MKTSNVKRAVNGLSRGLHGRRGARLAAGAAGAMALLGTAVGRGAVILPINAASVPVSNPASVFDVSNTGNNYTLAPGTNLVPEGFAVQDLFGGSLGTYGYESNDIIFQDNQPIGTVDTVNVTLAAPVSLGSFNLYLEDDGSNGNRSASEFLLYANGQLVDDVPILDSSGTQSYDGVYGSNYIQISDSLGGLPATANYTLELIQNQDAGGSSGVRALDFQGTAAVPEPASVAGIILSCGALARRPRRAAPK